MSTLLSQSASWTGGNGPGRWIPTKRVSTLIPKAPTVSRQTPASTSSNSSYSTPAYFKKEGMTTETADLQQPLIDTPRDSADLYQKQSALGSQQTPQERDQNILMAKLMGGIVDSNDGSHLSDFKPVITPSPSVQIGSNMTAISGGMHHVPTLVIDGSPTVEGFNNNTHNTIQPANVNSTKHEFSNYRAVYDVVPDWVDQSTTPLVRPKSNTPQNTTHTSLNVQPNVRMVDPELLHKIDKILALLEESKTEPTQYVMEEFALYTFLGVFVICTLDVFTRVGRYTR